MIYNFYTTYVKKCDSHFPINFINSGRNDFEGSPVKVGLHKNGPYRLPCRRIVGREFGQNVLLGYVPLFSGFL